MPGPATTALDLRTTSKITGRHVAGGSVGHAGLQPVDDHLRGVCLLGAVMSWFGFRSGTGKASAPAPAEVNVT